MTTRNGASGGRTDVKDAASSLFELGMGAYRRNDDQMAHIYLGVAGQLFEEARDFPKAEKARALVQDWKGPPG